MFGFVIMERNILKTPRCVFRLLNKSILLADTYFPSQLVSNMVKVRINYDTSKEKIVRHLVSKRRNAGQIRVRVEIMKKNTALKSALSEIENHKNRAATSHLSS